MQIVLRYGFLILATTILSAAGSSLRIRQGRPIVDEVYVNGSGPYRFLLDTGAESSQFDRRLAAAIGLRPTFQVEMVAAGGVARVSGAEAVRLRLANAEAPAEVLLTGMEAVREWAPDVQGVLGQSFLRQFDYRLDFRAEAIEFGAEERPGIRAELDRAKDRPVVFTSLGQLIVDSGTDRLILFGKSGGPLLVRTVSGAARGSVTSTKRLYIEGFEVKAGSAVALPRPRHMAEDGFLPAALFASVYFRNSAGYVVFE